jgi:hypothetical protein
VPPALALFERALDVRRHYAAGDGATQTDDVNTQNNNVVNEQANEVDGASSSVDGDRVCDGGGDGDGGGVGGSVGNGGKGNMLVAMRLNDVGMCLHAVGRNSEAVERLRDSVRMKSALIGSEHTDLAVTHHNLGIVQVGRKTSLFTCCDRSGGDTPQHGHRIVQMRLPIAYDFANNVPHTCPRNNS